MPGTDLKFTVGDVEAASAVLVAAATALIERGEPLWPVASLSPERLLRHYPLVSWRVAWHQGQAVGTYSLLETDPLFWPDDLPGAALYLHKLGVSPQAQGMGLSTLMLQRAVQETRERGLPLLKLDTAANRPKLRALYRHFGFTEVGEKQVGQFLVTLMEYPVPSA